MYKIIKQLKTELPEMKMNHLSIKNRFAFFTLAALTFVSSSQMVLAEENTKPKIEDVAEVADIETKEPEFFKFGTILDKDNKEVTVFMTKKGIEIYHGLLPARDPYSSNIIRKEDLKKHVKLTTEDGNEISAKEFIGENKEILEIFQILNIQDTFIPAEIIKTEMDELIKKIESDPRYTAAATLLIVATTLFVYRYL